MSGLGSALQQMQAPVHSTGQHGQRPASLLFKQQPGIRASGTVQAADSLAPGQHNAAAREDSNGHWHRIKGCARRARGSQGRNIVLSNMPATACQPDGAAPREQCLTASGQEENFCGDLNPGRLKPPFPASQAAAQAVGTDAAANVQTPAATSTVGSLEDMFAAWGNPSIRPTTQSLGLAALMGGVTHRLKPSSVSREDLVHFRVLRQVRCNLAYSHVSPRQHYTTCRSKLMRSNLLEVSCAALMRLRCNAGRMPAGGQQGHHGGGG